MIKNYISKDFNKKTIFENVVVYQNVFINIEDIFNFIKDTETYSDKEYVFSPWVDWNANWPGKATFIDKIVDINLDENFSEKELKEKNVIKNLYDACSLIIEDYLEGNKNNINFGYDIVDLDKIDKSLFSLSGATFLKYNKPFSREDFNYNSIAMNYHTDSFPEFNDSAENKLLITITIYFNDNYSGGQISFYNEKNGSVYNYKPKAGDITVFPSSRPFYHGVMPFDGDDRYLCRIFFQYYYDGSKEWNERKNILGEEELDRIEMEKRKQHRNDGSGLLEISYDGTKRTHFKTVFIDKNPIEVE